MWLIGEAFCYHNKVYCLVKQYNVSLDCRAVGFRTYRLQVLSRALSYWSTPLLSTSNPLYYYIHYSIVMLWWIWYWWVVDQKDGAKQPIYPAEVAQLVNDWSGHLWFCIQVLLGTWDLFWLWLITCTFSYFWWHAPFSINYHYSHYTVKRKH